MKNEKKFKGITLISLVITIVILIILASVAIYLNLGNNGIFTRAKEAKEATNRQTATEIINLKITTAQMNKYAEEQVMPTLKELSLVLKEDDEISYVTEISQVASENKKYEVGENPSSIFTKLDKYPSYEFEINGSLQLASINGVKIANSNSQNISQPTGIRTDAYITNTISRTTEYKNLTSMSGLTINKDENNKIDEYLSYSNEDGYTVLKAGWYFIKLSTTTYSSQNSGTDMYLYINGTLIAESDTWTATALTHDRNSFSIFLSQGTKIYFRSDGSENVTNGRSASATCYPMF